jgi:hypothetical protein
MTVHVRQGVLAVTALLALAVVCAVSWTPRPAADSTAATRAPRAAAAAAAPDAGVEAAPPPVRVRNVFEFADRTQAAPLAAPLPALSVPPPLAIEPMALASPPSPVRLVGFVRKEGTLLAALSLSGTVVVLAVGEEAEGYSVLALDEDAGVTLRTPDGSERVLPPPNP